MHPDSIMDRVGGFFGKGKWKIYTAGVLLATVGLTSVHTVDTTERGVVSRFSDFNRIQQPGLNFKMPFVEGVTRFPTDVQTIELGGNGGKEEGLETFTKDSQPIYHNLTVDYQLPSDPAKLENIYRNHQDYKVKLTKLVIDRLKGAIGQYDATTIALKRNEMTQAARDRISAEAQRLYGITVLDVKIPNYSFEPKFQEAVNAAARKKQEEQAARNQQEVDRINAENQVIRAQGAADAARKTADANSYRITQEGTANAAAIRAQSEALRENPQALVELERARKWNGQLPNQLLGTAPIPFFNTTPGARPN